MTWRIDPQPAGPNGPMIPILQVIILQDACKPSERERPQRDVEALCAAPIWPNGDPKLERRLTPLADALKWTSLRPSDTDPRPSWRWCRHCLGHAVTIADVVDQVLDAIVKAVST